ncbi:CBO0543 family protein [Lysinibacillus sp. SGAir0095]|uniref:CBO0543 family protein n=1 Tax=Lysinibacillus sp. SGAir0095 TaxID=2070463 RepID=UPI0010CCC06D|nr:CBO0543 family protein [Lysinibacillus sp. SGAir0095]QCR32572.1 hypothetical protein C1N55_10495 [Lysinibacillus sp. SGAir0095]
MQSSFVLFFMLIGILFGVWNRWKEFYPTLLFWIIANLLYDSLFHDFQLWEFIPVWIDHILLPTHTIISAAIALLIYPFVIVVFLGRFPEKVSLKILWILLWALIFQGIETIAYLNNSITHHHGWSLICSFIFNILTFSLLAVHKWKYWVAWLVALPVVILIFIIFDVPLPK